MDIGGTDIKLAASVDGRLAVYKEFDWFPAAFQTAEELLDPMGIYFIQDPDGYWLEILPADRG